MSQRGSHRLGHPWRGKDLVRWCNDSVARRHTPTMDREVRRPLFAGVSLAHRIERAEVDFLAAATGAAGRRCGPRGGQFVIQVAGGVASFAGRGSPFTKVAGLGFDGVPSAGELERIERAFAEAGSEVQVEVSSLADPRVYAVLAGRGYRLQSFENVLGRDLSHLPTLVQPAEVAVTVSPDDELERWLQIVIEGVLHPDEQGVPAQEQFDREELVNAERDLASTGVRRYLARLDGVPAGGAGLRIVDGIAEFAGAATLPAFRRRGVQSALLSARLADAAAAGCDVAVITVQPGSKSQENAQRRGFQLLYARAVMTRL